MTEGSSSLFLSFLTWWYIEAFKELRVFLGRFLLYITDLFSVKACLSTLFAPWKRDVLSMDRLSLQERFQIIVLNMASRIIGAMVKLITLAVFVFVIGIGAGICLNLIIVWLTWPIVCLLLMYAGIIFIRQ
jgi:hypothetical protein